MTNYEHIESSVRDTLGGVVWSHKIQEKQADIYESKFKRLETAKIISSSLTSAGIVSLLFTDELWIKIVSALLSFVSIFVGAFFKSFDLRTMVVQHKKTANELLTIRDTLKLLILQIHLKQDEPKILYEKYEQTVNQLHMVYSEAPNTSDKAVELASKALKKTKDNTFFDDEIDSYLPISLRKGDVEK